MTGDMRKKLSQKYCPRFGQLAVELGFINEKQLTDALACQVRQELGGQERLLLGEILFEKDWMTAEQIEVVVTEMFRRLRKDEA